MILNNFENNNFHFFYNDLKLNLYKNVYDFLFLKSNRDFYNYGSKSIFNHYIIKENFNKFNDKIISINIFINSEDIYTKFFINSHSYREFGDFTGDVDQIQSYNAFEIYKETKIFYDDGLNLNDNNLNDTTFFDAFGLNLCLEKKYILEKYIF